jgi:hypothetical protein
VGIEQVPPGARLYYVSPYYYGNGGNGVYQDAGLLRRNLEVVYAKEEPAIKEGAGVFYVFFPPPAPPHPRSGLEELMPRLYRANSPLLAKPSERMSSLESADSSGANLR